MRGESAKWDVPPSLCTKHGRNQYACSHVHYSSRLKRCRGLNSYLHGPILETKVHQYGYEAKEEAALVPLHHTGMINTADTRVKI